MHRRRRQGQNPHQRRVRGNSVVVRAVPADVVPEDVEDLVVELASRLVSNPRYTTSEKTEWVLHSIACRAAIKAGDKTHAAQLLR